MIFFSKIRYCCVCFFAGIAAGGILRLLLASYTYYGCHGGVTYLSQYPAINITGANGVVYQTAEGLNIWQVCIRN